MTQKKALITESRARERGSYLTEELLSRGHEVHGLVPRCGVGNTRAQRTERISHLSTRSHFTREPRELSQHFSTRQPLRFSMSAITWRSKLRRRSFADGFSTMNTTLTARITCLRLYESCDEVPVLLRRLKRMLGNVQEVLPD